MYIFHHKVNREITDDTKASVGWNPRSNGLPWVKAHGLTEKSHYVATCGRRVGHVVA